ncbi:DUF3078 domain-containing protein [bacterium]|nr:DUF3078 domain-containing protein [bacterium]
MANRYLLITMILTLLMPGIALAEDDNEPEYETEFGGWKLAGILTGGVHITEYQDWQAGGSDTVAFNGRYDFWATRSTESNEWRNRLRLEYGVTRTDEEDYRSSADILQFDTRYEHKLNEKFFLYIRGYLATHMGNQYDYFDDPQDIIFFDRDVEYQVIRTRVTKGFDPLNLEQGAGFGWIIHKNSDESTIIMIMAGAGTRQMLSENYFIEDDNPITPEVEYQHVDDYTDVGAEGVFDVTWTIKNNAKFSSHGAVFYGFEREQWTARWANSLDLKITKYIGVNLSAEMLFDEAVFDGNQWKLGTMLTFSYRVF